jgi:Protein of unknown function with HXXEE motif
MRDRNIIILLWSLPIVLCLHVFEEFAFPGGLRQWIKAYKPTKPKSDFWYISINAVPIVGTFYLALNASSVLDSRIYLCFVALMAGNAASHIRGTLQKKQYCPGTVSGVLLLLPLFVISYWYFLGAGKVDLLSAIICICVGIFFGFYVWGMDIRKADDAA